jgi:catechol 2,3-dioxygenase-like lactoylglutathione lyase family enzyme
VAGRVKVSRISQLTLDVTDVQLMADFWSRALGYRTDRGSDGSAKLYPPEGAAADVLTIWLQATGGQKQGKNRVHPDLNVTAGTVEEEVERLLALGATHADVGQSAGDPFVVLADPEGNEFCVLRNRPRG